MKIPATPFTATDWSQVTETVHPGANGEARWRTLDFGDVRVRRVDCSPGHVADHWCDRGHVLFVIDGVLVTELQDDRTFTLTAGCSCPISGHGDAAHRSMTREGARLFIVD